MFITYRKCAFFCVQYIFATLSADNLSPNQFHIEYTMPCLIDNQDNRFTVSPFPFGHEIHWPFVKTNHSSTCRSGKLGKANRTMSHHVLKMEENLMIKSNYYEIMQARVTVLMQSFLLIPFAVLELCSVQAHADRRTDGRTYGRKEKAATIIVLSIWEAKN